MAKCWCTARAKAESSCAISGCNVLVKDAERSFDGTVIQDEAGIQVEFSSGGDAVPGGYNGYFVARDGQGRRLGHLDYQLITDARWDDGMVAIAMVEVETAERRRGLGMALVERLQGEFPERSIDWGYLTPEGMGLKQAWDRRHSASVTIE